MLLIPKLMEMIRGDTVSDNDIDLTADAKLEVVKHGNS